MCFINNNYYNNVIIINLNDIYFVECIEFVVDDDSFDDMTEVVDTKALMSSLLNI